MENNYSNEQIKKVMEQYKKKRERENKNYHNKLKSDEEWCKGNKERALNHYYKNIDKNKEKYKKDKDFVNSRSMYSYYKRTNKIDVFKDKYPEKVELLKSRGIIIEEPKKEENNIILSFD
tara:strand:+ start:377 stop:736 length:360 start_codon:yes stop_codon:yes gene_type:complete